MDRAADGLVMAGDALAGIYNAVAQGLPEAMPRVDRALDLLERSVGALETIAHGVALDHGAWVCPMCGHYRYDTRHHGICAECAGDEAGG
jgi:hypothetical protein